jgi:D-alanyl-D-alanine carboxypeptidase/D-alanyl-D-alanine-endopeptidase (penicillin-binding protein 4)
LRFAFPAWLGLAVLCAVSSGISRAQPVAPPPAPAASSAPAAGEAETVLPTALPAPLAAAIRAAKLPASAVSIHVQEVGASRPLVSLNGDKPMNPASVMKLVTTYAALEMLGPSHQWKTALFEAGARHGDVLEGDLVIRGAGDPKLTQEQLWLGLKAVRARGVREIRGNIVLDHGAFDPAGYDASRFDGDPLRAYNAGPDALLINFKAFAFTFAPDEAGGVNVTVEPRPAGLPLRTTVKATAGPCIDFRAWPVKPKIDASGITVVGNYAAACGVRTWWIHPYELSQVQYAQAVLRQLWGDVGGVLAGDVRDGVVPAGARLLHEIESPSLAEVVRDINKFSNNVMARQLFLGLSLETLKLPGSAERSARAVRTWFLDKKIGGEELVMENGSGLSRTERIAAGSLGRLLVAAYRSPVMPEFIASMPLVAYDGTMRRRLRTRDVAGQAHVKTGTLNDVRAIGGYVLAASGRRLAVVCIVNHPNLAGTQAMQDALLQWVYGEG